MQQTQTSTPSQGTIACAPQYLSGGTPETNVELKDVREKQMLARSGYLRAHGGYIPAAAFRERRHFFAAKVLS